MNPRQFPKIDAALLTGGSDKPYVLGLAPALISQGATLDLIGSDELECRELRARPGMRFLNLRGSQRSEARRKEKILRILVYYARLIRYAAIAEPKLLHILWNNKFEAFDRTLLMLYYKLLGKKTILTAHNVNARKRDSGDTHLNRLTLRVQYRLADHIFVHTERMKRELIEKFGKEDGCITVIPFGINNALPITNLSSKAAKRRLGLRDGEKAILFFGRITPYKGLEYLIAAFRQVLTRRDDCRLVIAGRPDRCEEYWKNLRESIQPDVQSGRILLRPEFVPDDEAEVYLKAADVLVLPYRDIYQSGVLFLAYSFGLPVLATDVGSLKDDIVEGETGFVFSPGNPDDLAKTIERYFASELYANLDSRREQIRAYTEERHSWDIVARKTIGVYSKLLDLPSPEESANPDRSKAKLGTQAL